LDDVLLEPDELVPDELEFVSPVPPVLLLGVVEGVL